MSGDAAGFTGNIPEHYDSGLGPLLFVDFADDIARRVAAYKPEAERILETAAGTGIVTQRMHELMPEAEILATDLNLPMLEWAAKKFGPFNNKVSLRPADATSLTLGDNLCDVVVCQFGLMFFPDKEKSFREAHRVLVPGGRHVFSVWDSHKHNPFGRMAHEIASSFFPDNPPQFYQVPFGYYAIDPIKEALLAAGFEQLRITVVKKQKMIGDAMARARGMVLGNPLIDQIKARGGVDPDKVVEAAAKALEAEYGKKPVPLQAIVFEARKP